MKDVNYDNIKSQKKAGFLLLCENDTFGKTKGKGLNPPNLFRVNNLSINKV